MIWTSDNSPYLQCGEWITRRQFKDGRSVRKWQMLFWYKGWLAWIRILTAEMKRSGSKRYIERKFMGLMIEREES